MDSSFFQYPNLQFSPAQSSSSYVSQENFSPEYFNYQNQALPFNENDSQEMLLLGVLNQAPANYFDTTSVNSFGDDNEKRYSMKAKRSGSKKKKEKEMGMENILVLEDLGADYLEELLSISESSATPYW
ncbi:hypothetical protein SCA6_003016 [Theobroma cacao]